MTHFNSDICELTTNELDAVSGGAGGWAFFLSVAASAVWDGVKGEVGGEGFVAQAAKAADNASHKPG